MSKETGGLAEHLDLIAARMITLKLEPGAIDLMVRAASEIRLQRALLLYCLWHHQGGSSVVGHRLRQHLGIGEFAHLTDEQLAAAKSVSPDMAITQRKE
jgi:hypothetical protein